MDYLDVLAHSRTVGSRNGERRYQYEDGTWTEEGKARRREEYNEAMAKKVQDRERVYRSRKAEAQSMSRKDLEWGLKRDKMVEDYARMKPQKDADGFELIKQENREKSREKVDSLNRKIAGTTQAMSSAASLQRKIGKQNTKAKYTGMPKEDLKAMSDYDLRQIVNRELLERQYENMYTEYDDGGAAERADAIEIAKDIVQIFGGIAAVAIPTYEIIRFARM